MGKCSAMFDRCELILVNDCSTDGSIAEIHRYLAEHPAEYMVSIIRMGVFQGLEASMNAGRDIAIGDYVFEFDDLYLDYSMDVIRGSL
jgi:glycosyltransferase involved in cell wall biosynthesis